MEEEKDGPLQLFCAACHIEYNTDKEYKIHYKSEFHRYNIKRKMIDLMPVEQSVYEKKFFDSQSQSKATSSSSTMKCEICSKSFQTVQTFNTHLESKKHKVNAKDPQKLNKTIESTSSTEKKVVTTSLTDQNVCLFCDFMNESIEKNLEHMNIKHGFFIIESKYCSNQQGLIKLLAQQIHDNIQCICCYYQDYDTPQALKMHMQDKQHCFMNEDAMEDYIVHYDFQMALDDFEKEILEKQKLENIEEEQNEDLKEIKEGEQGDEDWEDEGEDDEEEVKQIEEDIQNIENTKIYQHLMKSKKTDRTDKENDDQFEEKYAKYLKYKLANMKFLRATIRGSGEAVLPGGKLLGHRQYKQYYNMTYRPMRNVEHRMKEILGERGFEQRQISLIQWKYELMALERKNHGKDNNKLDNRVQRQESWHRGWESYMIGVKLNKAFNTKPKI